MGTQIRFPMARTYKFLIPLYTFCVFAGFFSAISQSTSSWLIKDHVRNRIFDEYHGIWKLCFDGANQTCDETIGTVWLNLVRISLIFAFLMYAIVLGYFISMWLRKDIVLKVPAAVLLLSAVVSTIGLSIYTAKSQNPVGHTYEYRSHYGYSFVLAWMSTFFTYIGGLMCLSESAF